MWIRALADADAATCGAKAASLARLVRAGLPVPDGFVLEAAAFSALVAPALPPFSAPPEELGHALADADARAASVEIPAALAADVLARAAVLERLAVRSSAAIEDGTRGAAAGVFASRTGVDPADVWDAIRAVWASALAPLAVAYARRRADAPPPGMAVIVQRFAPGERVTIYTRAPSGAAELWIQRGEAIERAPRESPGAPLREPLRIALSTRDPLADEASVDLAAVQERRFEIWPREMAPGFYDAVLAACRATGFEPDMDEPATGNTVWGYIARGRGVALINDSLRAQQPRGVTLVEATGADHVLSIEAVWHGDAPAMVDRVVEAAVRLARERSWI